MYFVLVAEYDTRSRKFSKHDFNFVGATPQLNLYSGKEVPAHVRTKEGGQYPFCIDAHFPTGDTYTFNRQRVIEGNLWTHPKSHLPPYLTYSIVNGRVFQIDRIITSVEKVGPRKFQVAIHINPSERY